MSKKETETPKETKVQVKVEAEVAKPEVSAPTITISKSTVKSYITAFVVVTVIIFGALYLMEKEGRSKTNIFESVLAAQEAKKTVAIVNGEKIINSDLSTSIQQFSQAAAAQGVDISNSESLAEIRTQALDVLINTKLLKQVAIEKGLSVSEEEVSERLAAIEEEIGGPDVLSERMEVLGITSEQLKRDIQDELIIQQLLDTLFDEADSVASEEEILELYENAGGAEAGLPPLEEVREQIEVQVNSTKEQTIIDNYLEELKTNAEIELL